MSRVHKLLEQWVSLGQELGMNFVDVYAPNKKNILCVVVFAQNEQAYREYVQSACKEYPEAEIEVSR